MEEEPQPQLRAYLQHAYLELPAPANTTQPHSIPWAIPIKIGWITKALPKLNP